MFHLIGFVVSGLLVLLVLGVALKLAWLVGSLILLPLKLLFSLAAVLLTSALVLFFLPATIVVILALLGGLAFAVFGVFCILF